MVWRGLLRFASVDGDSRVDFGDDDGIDFYIAHFVLQ